jgi:NO-binding membrane sensor protein with MHYT domain
MTLLDIAIILPLLAVLLVWRVRRAYARRQIRLGILMVCAVIAVVLAARLVQLAVVFPHLTPAAAGGVLLGLLMGGIGISGESFERDHAGLWYRPDPFIGSVLLVMIVSWIAYRVINLHGGPGQGFMAGADSPPWTLFVPTTIVAYWLVYFAAVLRHRRTEVRDGKK